MYLNKIRLLLMIAALYLTVPLKAQTVVTVPVYPTDLDSVTVIYDATKGNGALANVPPPIYAHTGVITNLSSNSGDWKYVIAPWTTNLAKARMTPLGNNLYQIKMSPSIRAWYGVPSAEQILKLAFVFRNSDGSIVGREANGGDIFANVYPATTSITIQEPTSRELYPRLNDTIPILATSPLADTIKMFVNNNLVKKVAGTVFTDTLLANNFGQFWTKNWVKLLGKNDTASKADSFFYEVIPTSPVATLPAGTLDGINYLDSTTVILSLFAPGKDHCFAIGDFNDWQLDSQYYMNKTPDGTHFWIQINNLIPRKEYIFQYLVDGAIRIADPYADKISDPNDQYISSSTYPGLLPYPSGKTTGNASYLQTAQTPYSWTPTSFTPPAPTDLIIYELLIRDFIATHDYPGLIDTLDYFKRLGVNAIELMPVMEFEGNDSWGYNPDFEFAPDKYYGTKNGLKQFVEAAHAKGIAVILDIVLNHQFEQSPLVMLYWDGANSRPAANNPWFNPIPKHPYNVGNDFNHESLDTRAYCKRVIKYWLQEYHVDGYRFDMSKGFTQTNSYPDNMSLWAAYDTGRIAILKDYASAAHSINPNAYVILEHFADNSEETELSADGMLLWGNLNYNYNEATEGWNTGSLSDFSWISYKQMGWTDPHLVGYMESHDEERLMFNNIHSSNVNNTHYYLRDTTLALKRNEMAAAFFYTVPGPKMLWQFGELGYDYSINYPCMTSDCRLSDKPIRWDYYKDWRRRYLFNTCSSLMNLKLTNDAFRSNNFSMSVTGSMKHINIISPTMNVVVVGNFDVYQGAVTPGFSQTGPWYDFFGGDTLNVATLSDQLTLQPGEYHIYTTVKLPKPQFTGIDETSINAKQNGRYSFVYPNPSSGVFNIQYTLDNPLHVLISVSDMIGRPVVGLLDAKVDQGTHTVVWNGLDHNGQKVSRGLYLYKFEAGDHHEVGKLIVE
jgi:1,4-alpha-glucan branching enzyme